MFAPSIRRGNHRKRVSAFRLSSDSTATTLPVYTSPSPQRHPDLSDLPSEQPPAYSDSAEEADEDTDESETEASVTYIPSPPPSLPVSPRRARRSQGSSRASHRRQKSISTSSSDPYLDSLLERSVHALEMSNALLQSSMSTQSSLSAVLADDALVDRHLEQRAQRLNSRIRSNRDQQRSWMDDLDEITRGVEGLVNGDSSDEDDSHLPSEPPVSQSLPSTSGFSQRMQARADRLAPSDIRRQNHRASQSTTSLQLSAHERSDFVAAAPRAITMYIDTAEAADSITLPSTLGVRPSARTPPTPLLSQTAFSGSATASEAPRSASASSERPSSRAAEMLASYVMPRGSHSRSPPASTARRRSSSSSASTVRRARVPPPAIRVDAPSTCSSTALSSRSLTPVSGSPALRQPRPLTPPIEELSTSSGSSESATLHVDRTVESLRQILEKQRSPSQSSRNHRSSSAHSAPPRPRPSLLSPPIVAPISSTSTATASVSRLFTKGRHTTSRGQSPPRQSSLKKSSVPSTPVSPMSAIPSPSPSMLSVPDLFGLGRNKSGGSSGSSTPKRISFIEPPEPYSSSKPDGSSSKFFPTKTRSKSSGKGKGRGRDPKGKGKGKARDDESDSVGVGWWTGWLLGAAGAESGSGLGIGVGHTRSEERYAYANPSARGGGVVGTWSMRHGYGGSLEEWGA
ncbi:hypothetical protein GSI_01114 [Ganoderma sinense ZZ0214-1]|uniref:Uncharacterized protein n=1 Tax=Ganoderma sinense ZZ0214-1 TaxID=1077348 RepID=A0A2G8SUI1_9APHY|nr:hypothetical protein GSI_01114 [Ganoderma sinense ZZ0214-1]